MQAFFMSESKEILRLERPDGHREGQGLPPCSPRKEVCEMQAVLHELPFIH